MTQTQASDDSDVSVVVPLSSCCGRSRTERSTGEVLAVVVVVGGTVVVVAGGTVVVVVVVGGGAVVVVAGTVVLVVGGGAVVVVAGALLVVDAPAVTVGVTGAVVETPGLEVDDAAGSDVVDSPGCVVVELTDGRVGRLPPEPPHAASTTTATNAIASTTPRRGMHPFTESGVIAMRRSPSVPPGDAPEVASLPVILADPRLRLVDGLMAGIARIRRWCARWVIRP